MELRVAGHLPDGETADMGSAVAVAHRDEIVAIAEIDGGGRKFAAAVDDPAIRRHQRDRVDLQETALQPLEIEMDGLRTLDLAPAHAADELIDLREHELVRLHHLGGMFPKDSHRAGDIVMCFAQYLPAILIGD